MQYPVDGSCPKDFGCRIPMLEIETTYIKPVDVAPGAGNYVLATGDSTGYSLHGDFFHGFSVRGDGKPSLLNQALTSCPDMKGGTCETPMKKCD